MSADNYIGVYPRAEQWIVVDGCASIEMEDCQYRGSEISFHDGREDALIAAHDHAKNEAVLEYGVIEFPSIPEKFCGRCYVCVHERNVIDPKLERCDHCGEPISSSEWTVITRNKVFHSRCEKVAISN